MCFKSYSKYSQGSSSKCTKKFYKIGPRFETKTHAQGWIVIIFMLAQAGDYYIEVFMTIKTKVF